MIVPGCCSFIDLGISMEIGAGIGCQGSEVRFQRPTPTCFFSPLFKHPTIPNSHRRRGKSRFSLFLRPFSSFLGFLSGRPFGTLLHRASSISNSLLLPAASVPIASSILSPRYLHRTSTCSPIFSRISAICGLMIGVTAVAPCNSSDLPLNG